MKIPIFRCKRFRHVRFEISAAALEDDQSPRDDVGDEPRLVIVEIDLRAQFGQCEPYDAGNISVFRNRE